MKCFSPLNKLCLLLIKDTQRPSVDCVGTRVPLIGCGQALDQIVAAADAGVLLLFFGCISPWYSIDIGGGVGITKVPSCNTSC